MLVTRYNNFPVLTNATICHHRRYLTVTSDMLTAVKKMEESLKRLKKAKSASGATSQGLSDDDKIRLQLYLDVKQFGEKVRPLEIIILLLRGGHGSEE